MNLTALHPYLLTKKDATTFTLLLERLLDGFFKEGFNMQETLTRETPYELKKAIKKILSESNIKIDNKTEQEVFLRRLKEEVSQLPIVHLILAFSPREDFISTIQDWFYQNYKKTVLLEISTDESLVAGMVVSFNGLANDYSIKNQINQMTKPD